MRERIKTRSSAATPERVIDGPKNAECVALQEPVSGYDNTFLADMQQQTGSNQGKAVLTVADIGLILGVSRPTAYKIIGHPDFPKIFVGRNIRIPAANFERWLTRQADLGANVIREVAL